MRKKKVSKNQKLKKIIKEQDRIIKVLSNTEIINGLKSALKDFKKKNYTILTK